MPEIQERRIGESVRRIACAGTQREGFGEPADMSLPGLLMTE